jgi:erythromycin esterase-like protein
MVADFNERKRTRKSINEYAGFFGLDLYSMTSSIHAVLAYLNKIDPVEAAAARERYACLGQFINDPQAYGYAIAPGRWDSCEQDVIEQRMQLQRKARIYIERDGPFAGSEYFSALQNAEVVKNAEEYYRALFRGRPNTWNLRDRHMFETLEKLADHLEAWLGREPRIVVWAHNSHLGNAAATDMARSAVKSILASLFLNITLRRCSVSAFRPSRGTVTAATDWDGPAETKIVREPLPGSYEEIFTRLEKKSFYLDLRGTDPVADLLRTKRL